MNPIPEDQRRLAQAVRMRTGEALPIPETNAPLITLPSSDLMVPAESDLREHDPPRRRGTVRMRIVHWGGKPKPKETAPTPVSRGQFLEFDEPQAPACGPNIDSTDATKGPACGPQSEVIP